jgi:hypothetical protein
MSNFSELGPLDVQLTKEDELVTTSGLNYFHAMLMLKQQAFDMFEEYFLQLKKLGGGTITTKTAAEIASSITVGLLSPLSNRIDPIRLGEVDRAMKIAMEYGRRLSDNTEAIYNLSTDYPSHDFVIDFEEAKKILNNVREPDEREQKLGELLFAYCREESHDDCIFSIYPSQRETKNGKKRNKSNRDENKETIKDNEGNSTKDEQESKTDTLGEDSKNRKKRTAFTLTESDINKKTGQ